MKTIGRCCLRKYLPHAALKLPRLTNLRLTSSDYPWNSLALQRHGAREKLFACFIRNLCVLQTPDFNLSPNWQYSPFYLLRNAYASLSIYPKLRFQKELLHGRYCFAYLCFDGRYLPVFGADSRVVLALDSYFLCSTNFGQSCFWLRW